MIARSSYSETHVYSRYRAYASCVDVYEPEIKIWAIKRFNSYWLSWAHIREKQEHAYKLIISNIFNVYAAPIKLQRLFSKSGFIGGVAKRRKGKM